MSYPADHAKYPNQPKGITAVLIERNLYQAWLRGKCEKKCNQDVVACCNKHIMKLQPDFLKQKSLVQETMEGLGHLCLFLPKFHCKLNFIEFFWGAVKRYLHKNCDYTSLGALDVSMDGGLLGQLGHSMSATSLT
jgi:transposase